MPKNASKTGKSSKTARVLSLLTDPAASLLGGSRNHKDSDETELMEDAPKSAAPGLDDAAAESRIHDTLAAQEDELMGLFGQRTPSRARPQREQPAPQPAPSAPEAETSRMTPPQEDASAPEPDPRTMELLSMLSNPSTLGNSAMPLEDTPRPSALDMDFSDLTEGLESPPPRAPVEEPEPQPEPMQPSYAQQPAPQSTPQAQQPAPQPEPPMTAQSPAQQPTPQAQQYAPQPAQQPYAQPSAPQPTPQAQQYAPQPMQPSYAQPSAPQPTPQAQQYAPQPMQPSYAQPEPPTAPQAQPFYAQQPAPQAQQYASQPAQQPYAQPSAPQSVASPAHELKKKQEEFVCFNLTQALVEDKADKLMQQFGMCTCNRCRVDVTALALSNLPAKYVAMQNRDVLPLLSMHEEKYSAAVTVQVMSACKKVMQRPHHGRK